MSQTIIGRAERIDFPAQNLQGVPARIDTGATTSSLWASQIREVADGLEFVLFDASSPHYTGDVVHVNSYEQRVVSSSTGNTQLRYVVQLPVVVAGRRVRAKFTLADRVTQVYPVLLGRSILRGKFIVDVKLGQPLIDEEQKRRDQLREWREGKGKP